MPRDMQRPLRVITATDDTSPMGQFEFVLWNPPFVDDVAAGVQPDLVPASSQSVRVKRERGAASGAAADVPGASSTKSRRLTRGLARQAVAVTDTEQACVVPSSSQTAAAPGAAKPQIFFKRKVPRTHSPRKQQGQGDGQPEPGTARAGLPDPAWHTCVVRVGYGALPELTRPFVQALGRATRCVVPEAQKCHIRGGERVRDPGVRQNTDLTLHHGACWRVGEREQRAPRDDGTRVRGCVLAEYQASRSRAATHHQHPSANRAYSRFGWKRVFVPWRVSSSLYPRTCSSTALTPCLLTGT